MTEEKLESTEERLQAANEKFEETSHQADESERYVTPPSIIVSDRSATYSYSVSISSHS